MTLKELIQQAKEEYKKQLGHHENCCDCTVAIQVLEDQMTKAAEEAIKAVKLKDKIYFGEKGSLYRGGAEMAIEPLVENLQQKANQFLNK